MSVDKYILEKSALVDKRLKTLIPLNPKCLQNELFKAANYALHSGGKRLRPILVLAATESFGVDILKALDVACAIEMIHTYSLIHDDLPSMDNDDFRRNKPSLHKAYSEWLALLTGDYLHSFAFEVIANALLSDKTKIKLVALLANKIGPWGLIGGQYVDLCNKKIDQEKLEFMHINKTASLISASVASGAIIANRSEKEIKALLKFGTNLGFAFQIVDDLLDYATKDKNKACAVSILGQTGAKKRVEMLFQEALSSLDSLSFSSDLLKNLSYKLIKRKT